MYPGRFGGVAASTPRDAIRQAAQAFVEAIRAVVGG
jgi:hypothetical protein